jgi:hypothetical protein
MSSDLPGVNPTTLNGMLLYYRLMTKWSGLGDSTELSRVGLSHRWWWRLVAATGITETFRSDACRAHHLEILSFH